MILPGKIMDEDYLLQDSQSHRDSDSKAPKTEKSASVNQVDPKRRHSSRSLSTISNVLNKLVGTLGLDKRLKEHTLMSLWPTLIGDTFAQKSRPLFIDSELNLVIAVKDASVAQELSLLKTEIVKKLRIAANTMNLTINGMRFDLKHFHNSTQVAFEEAVLANLRPLVKEPTTQELESISISEPDLKELAILKANLSAQTELSSGLHDRVLFLFERELKLRNWRAIQGFPQCPKCSSHTQKLFGSENLCADCYSVVVLVQDF